MSKQRFVDILQSFFFLNPKSKSVWSSKSCSSWGRAGWPVMEYYCAHARWWVLCSCELLHSPFLNWNASLAYSGPKKCFLQGALQFDNHLATLMEPSSSNIWIYLMFHLVTGFQNQASICPRIWTGRDILRLSQPFVFQFVFWPWNNCDPFRATSGQMLYWIWQRLLHR